MKHTIQSLLVAFLVLVAGGRVRASVVAVSINDLSPNIACQWTGLDPASVAIQQVTDALDMHGAYVSNSALAPGLSVVMNFNIYDPVSEGGRLSDTLSVVVTGVTPVPGNLNNTYVEVHFRSESNLVTLPNATALTETGQWQDLSTYIAYGGGPGDLSLSLASEVAPEPRSLLFWGSALVLAMGVCRRRMRHPS